MQTVLVVNPKGGSGKTTVAVHIAVALVERGHRTVLADFDRQNSALAWERVRSDRAHPVAVIDGDAETGLQEGDWTRVDRLVIDAPANLPTDSLKRLVGLADRVVVPVLPGRFDQEATRDFLQALAGWREARGKTESVAVVANRLRLRTNAAKRLDRFLAELGFETVAQIRDSQVYPDLVEEGLTLFDVTDRRRSNHDVDWRPLIQFVEGENRGSYSRSGETAPGDAVRAGAAQAAAAGDGKAASLEDALADVDIAGSLDPEMVPGDLDTTPQAPEEIAQDPGQAERARAGAAQVAAEAAPAHPDVSDLDAEAGGLEGELASLSIVDDPEAEEADAGDEADADAEADTGEAAEAGAADAAAKAGEAAESAATEGTGEADETDETGEAAGAAAAGHDGEADDSALAAEADAGEAEALAGEAADEGEASEAAADAEAGEAAEAADAAAEFGADGPAETAESGTEAVETTDETGGETAEADEALESDAGAATEAAAEADESDAAADAGAVADAGAETAEPSGDSADMAEAEDAEAGESAGLGQADAGGGDPDEAGEAGLDAEAAASDMDAAVEAGASEPAADESEAGSPSQGSDAVAETAPADAASDDTEGA